MKQLFLHIWFLVAVSLVLSCCSKKEEPTPGPAPGPTPDPDPSEAFTAETSSIISPDASVTKTTLEPDYQVFWQEGDVILINGCRYAAENAGNKSSFKKVDSEAKGKTYKAYYPVSIYNGGILSLPEVQQYEKGTIKNFPMYAESSSRSLSFVNICGAIAVKVKGKETEKVKKIEVSSPDKGMSGTFTIENNAAVLTAEARNKKKSVVLDCGTGVSLATDSVFFISIPADTYSRMMVRVTVDNGSNERVYLLESENETRVVRNTINCVNIQTTTGNKEITIEDTYGVKILDQYLVGLGTYQTNPSNGLDGGIAMCVQEGGGLCAAGCNITDNGDVLVGRNFDMPLSPNPAYVFKTSFGKYKTFNVAYLHYSSYPTFETVVSSGIISDNIKKQLPYVSSDVFNEKGLYMSMNMRVIESQFATSGTNPGKTRVEVVSLPQRLCMNCATIDEAVQMARNDMDIYVKQGYHLGFMMADSTGKYGILEIVSNQVIFNEGEPAHSNFWISRRSESKYPEGIGRYDVIKENISGIQTEQQMFDLLGRTDYCHVYYDPYKDSTEWHYDIRSDFVEWTMPTYDTEWLLDDANFAQVSTIMKNQTKDYQNKTEAQLRSMRSYWMSSVATVTNCTQKSMTIQLFEKPEYRFVFRWNSNDELSGHQPSDRETLEP